MSHSSKNIFFIIGRGRSGTDLLQRLLNTNPNICIPPESSIIPLLHNKYQDVPNWKEQNIKEFSKDVFLDEKISAWWGVKRKDLRNYLFSNYPKNFREAIINVYQFYAYKLEKKGALIGDKNPSNSLYINEILSVFQNAKFIYIVRNPLDNVFSFTNVEFDSNDPKVLAHRWKYYNDQVLKYKNKYPEKFHTLHFENLIENTNEELNRISKFLEIDNLYNIKNKEKGNHKWQNNLSEDISRTHINKGKRNFTEIETQYINSVCHSSAMQLGYELKGEEQNHYNIKAWFFNRIEKHFIRLPLYLSARILKYYRRKKIL